jgi:hypothetical protein
MTRLWNWNQCDRYYNITADGKPVGWPLPENRCLKRLGHDGRHLFEISKDNYKGEDEK